MASPVTCDMMREATKSLEQNLDLPAGYYVKLDERTDNILVANEKLGFCVTPVYIEDHPDSYIELTKEYLKQLRQITDNCEQWSRAGFYTPDEMERQARFD